MSWPEIRQPAYAGHFYPASAAMIRRQIDSFLPEQTQKIDALGCMLPHAGYQFSARVAVETVAGIKIKKRIVLLGPSHTGIGPIFSIMSSGRWRTPLGEVEIDSELARRIADNSALLEEDFSAHISEHSLEVELPILQYFKDDFKIVPIVFMPAELEALREIGRAIALALKEPPFKDSCLIIASSDMTHYESEEQAAKKDQAAIEAITALDEEALCQKVRQLAISMCGYAPTAAMLSALKLLGAKKGKLVKYQTSAEATQDRTSVVGYAGILFC